MEGLADKVVLVTGGSSGIGEACARRLAVEGCAVMVAGRDEVKTRAVAESLLPDGKHDWVTGDHDRAALHGQTPRARFADPRRTAGDQNDFVGQTFHSDLRPG